MHSIRESIFLANAIEDVKNWYSIIEKLGLRQSAETSIRLEQEERDEFAFAIALENGKEILDAYLDCLWTSANLVRQGLRSYREFENLDDQLRLKVECACDFNQLELLPETIYLNWEILVQNNASKILHTSTYTEAQLRSLKIRTSKKYWELGISVEILCNTSYSCFTAASDCYDVNNKFVPAGKLLKPINWREPQWLIPKKLFRKN